MTNKEKIIEQMRKYGIKKAVYTPGLDFEAKHPCGDIVFAGEQNSEFTKPIWDLYDFSDVEDEDNRFCVWMAPEDSSSFRGFELHSCKEVLNV